MLTELCLQALQMRASGWLVPKHREKQKSPLILLLLLLPGFLQGAI
jgi:hypothetical protein